MVAKEWLSSIVFVCFGQTVLLVLGYQRVLFGLVLKIAAFSRIIFYEKLKYYWCLLNNSMIDNSDV